MPRKSTTQWEFNNLFPDDGRRQIFSVSELSRQIKRLLEERIGLVWVSGEISGLKLQSSGHIYFTLKDEFSQVQCVLFRGEEVERESLQDGIKVLIQGDLTVYEPRGVYQIVIKKVELIGAGSLQIAFEKLKKKLQAEGLFSLERKRKIPLFPKKVGIVTSPTSAALRDILHVIGRRYAGIEIILSPCKVQGEGAEIEIASAIKMLNEYSNICPEDKKIDVILVSRGGGSLEDLSSFNDEIVARAVFSSSVPVISAVGHEIDFTICDFVADLRAATPSAAAEILTANYVAAKDHVVGLYNQLTTICKSYIEGCKRHFKLLLPQYFRLRPQKYIQEKWQYLDDLQIRLNRPVKICIKENTTKLHNLITRLIALRPIDDVKNKTKNMSDLKRRLTSITLQSLNEKRMTFLNIKDKIELLSPEGILKRGYSITIDKTTNKIIKSINNVKDGQVIKTNVSDGSFDSTVKM